jgi:hypothetical protein
VDRAQVLSRMVQIALARDRNNPRLLRHQPS